MSIGAPIDGKTSTARDYSIAFLSGMGFIGLLVGFWIMSYQGKNGHPSNSTSSFHEIDYHPRVIIGQAFKALTDSLNKDLSPARESLKKSLLLLPKSNDPNYAAAKALVDSLQDKIRNDSTSIALLDSYKALYEDASLSDSISFTTLNGMLHFQIRPDTLAQWECDFAGEGFDWKATSGYWVKIPKSPLRYFGKADFKIAPVSSNMQFIGKYPEAGTWVFLIIIFCSFCFIAITTSIMITSQIFSLSQTKLHNFQQWAYYVIWAAILAALIALYFVGRGSFNDELAIKRIFFMANFKNAMLLVNGLGYLAGASCLAGFIYSASMLSYFANRMKDQLNAIATNTDSTSGQPPMATLVASHSTLKETYDRLQGYFNTYFTLSAAILSLLVFCTGALFSTVNSLDFIKLLSANWGYSPARTDIVYLFGGLYTVVLLLIYLPAKMRFRQIQLELPPEPPTDKGGAAPAPGGNLNDLLKDPFGMLKGVLVAASPLLAGILQSLLSLLFNH